MSANKTNTTVPSSESQHPMRPANPATAHHATHRPASSFPLTSIRLLDGDFKRAQETSLRYLLELDADRLLAPYLHEAGLHSSATSYGSWEADGMGGHIGGHYLSACAQMYAATGDQRLRDRVEYIVGALGRCQDVGGDGYVGGVPGGRALGAELAAGTVDADLFTLNGRWVPLYNLHKSFAGLLDAYMHAHSTEALTIVCGLADWWMTVAGSIPDTLFEEILHAEFGGMNDAFAILAGITGNAGYLEQARRFSHRVLLDTLAEGRDELDGLHANTQIPKVVGYERLGAATGDVRYVRAADSFWNTLVANRTVSIGGNSVREHFHPSSDFTPMIQDAQGPETCNTYNMLKLAKLRFERTGDPAAIEFYERALYNHILSSQHPHHGGLVYFTSMRPAHYRVYSTAQESMWCCVGSGLENHARYAELIYSDSEDCLLVNLYAASELNWDRKGIQVRLETDFPRADTANLLITAASPIRATIRLRRPSWALQMEVRIDGSPVVSEGDDNGYITMSRTWEGTTTLTLRLETGLQAELLPDGSPWVSYRFGPVVLAARAGTRGVEAFQARDERMGHVAAGMLLPLSQTPVVSVSEPLDAIALSDRAAIKAELTATAVSGPVTLTLEPFAGIHDERYTVYWPAGPVDQRLRELRALDKVAAGLEQIIDAVTAGEQQPESDHAFAGEATRAGGREGIHWRSATGWFSYVLKDANRQGSILRIRFRVVEGRAHEIRLNGTPLRGSVRMERADNQVIHEFDIADVPRSTGDGGQLVISVHSLDGRATGDLLEVQLLKEAVS